MCNTGTEAPTGTSSDMCTARLPPLKEPADEPSALCGDAPETRSPPSRQETDETCAARQCKFEEGKTKSWTARHRGLAPRGW